jgi:large subunit ribosomal protein L23
MSILSQAKKILKRDEAKPKQAAKKSAAKKAKPAEAKKAVSVSIVPAGQMGLSVVLSEKSIAQQIGNVVVVRVKPSASKPAIASAVEQLFSVNVLSVRTSRVHPKRRQRGTTIGRTQHWKKAYVTVDDISKLNVAP